MINFDEFKKVELRVGKVISAERVEGSEKLLKLAVDLGEENPRQIISGIAKAYEPEDLVEKLVAIVANLEPRSIMGLESQGMILAASGEDGPVVLSPGLDAAPGALIT